LFVKCDFRENVTGKNGFLGWILTGGGNWEQKKAALLREMDGEAA
jgi:hypothetical protein